MCMESLRIKLLKDREKQEGVAKNTVDIATPDQLPLATVDGGETEKKRTRQTHLMS